MRTVNGEVVVNTREAAAVLKCVPNNVLRQVTIGRLVPVNTAPVKSGHGGGYEFRLSDVSRLYDEQVRRSLRRAQRLAAQARVRRTAAKLAQLRHWRDGIRVRPRTGAGEAA